MGGPENFPLLYLVKMSLRRWMGGSKKPQIALHNIKLAPYQSPSEMPGTSVIYVGKYFVQHSYIGHSSY